MGLLDSLKGLFGGKTDDTQSGIDEAADLADDTTGGDHTEHIDEGADLAGDQADKPSE